jgi:hypothetical protein
MNQISGVILNLNYSKTNVSSTLSPYILTPFSNPSFVNITGIVNAVRETSSFFYRTIVGDLSAHTERKIQVRVWLPEYWFPCTECQWALSKLESIVSVRSYCLVQLGYTLEDRWIISW